MEGPKQFDNINNKLVDDLKVTLNSNRRLSIAAASFSIYAYQDLKEELQKIDELRFIFTEPTFNKSEVYIPKLGRERTLYGSDFEIKLCNALTQKVLTKRDNYD